MRGLMACLAIPLGLALMTVVAKASPPILLDEDTIDVTTSFRGTEIEITTFLEDPDPDIRLAIIGPPATLTFRRKARRAGMWINAEKDEISGAASYVALVGLTEQRLNEACARNAVDTLMPTGTVNLLWICNRAQRNLMADKGLFSIIETSAGIADLGQGFHRATAFLPPTAKPGTYNLQFWVGDDLAESQFQVQRAGLERLVLATAQNHRLFYGVLCLVLAALAGWLTNLIFSRRD